MKTITPLFRMLLWFVLALCCIVISVAQGDAAMERFDIEGYHQNQKGGIWLETLSDGTSVRSFELSSSGFLQEVKPLHSPYTYKKAFNFEGNLIASVTEFYQFPIGMSKFYDDHGKLIREENNDEGFNFSVENLVKEMEVRFGVNIMNPEEIMKMTRFIDHEHTQKPLYTIYSYKEAAPGNVMAYLIDGNSGKVLLMLELASEGDRRTIFDEYLKNIAE